MMIIFCVKLTFFGFASLKMACSKMTCFISFPRIQRILTKEICVSKLLGFLKAISLHWYLSCSAGKICSVPYQFEDQLQGIECNNNHLSSYSFYFRSVCYSSLHQLTLAHSKSKKMRADRSGLLSHSSLALSLFRQAPSLLLSFQGRRLKINPPNQPLDEHA